MKKVNVDVHKLVQNTYDKIADKYHERYSEYSEFFLKFSKEFMNLLPKKARILDLGCGSGRDSKFFSEKGYKVTGVDFSENMLAIAKKVAPKAKFIKQDLRKIKFLENSFDGVRCSFVLLHLKRNEIPSLLHKIHQILKKNGVLFISTKQGEGEIVEKESLDQSFEMFETFFQKDELEQLVIDAGFELLLTDLGYDRYENDEKIIVILAKKITEL
ncbi:MAG: class I SAM-dependent methyltransferase [Patescibacteria group bacterium]|jgi:ubiquinone/menaquinone biosynthesis C-methylase UbiE